ncbi:MAG: glycosyltransferase, partial [Pseudomonadota bacterium]
PTLDSILGQEDANVECIVVDGGSTDGTLAILDSYGDRLRWISEPDQGFGDAINKGWRMARGDILAWLNADDTWIVPDAARRAVAYLQEHDDADVVYGDCGTIDADGRLTGMAYLRKWDFECAVLECDHCIPQPAAFVRRRAIDRVGDLDPTLLKVDHDLWLRIGARGGIHYLPGVLAFARRIAGHSSDVEKIAADCVRVTEKILQNPDTSPRILDQKEQALSSARLRAAHYASSGDLARQTVEHAAHALLHDPSRAVEALAVLAGLGKQAPARHPVMSALAGGLSKGRRVARLFRRYSPVGHLDTRPRVPNLAGDRDIEWMWIAANLPPGPGRALDFGAGSSPLGLAAALRGFVVDLVDPNLAPRSYLHTHLRELRGDLLKLPLALASYDLVISCSTVEHVGVAGRYGIQDEDADGDLIAMQRIGDLLRTGGRVVMTVPVGRDAVFRPNGRVYGAGRLPALLAGFSVEKQDFFIKDDQNRWTGCERSMAEGFEASCASNLPSQNVYALGCFVLSKGRPC